MTLTLKTIYMFFLAGALAIVIGGKIPAIGKYFLAKEPANQHVGDLYRLCEVDRFLEKIRVLAPTPTAPLEQAEILTLGDSFFNSALDSDQFANELGRKGRFSVHNLTSSDFFEPHSFPLAYLQASGYQPNQRRILILESVERTSLERTESYLLNGGISRNRFDSVAFKVLKNNDVEYFFKNNLITHPALKWLKNIRFDFFGIIDRAIGAYSVRPDMLFYQRDIDFATLTKPDEVLDAAADRVARLAAILRQQHNIELLYFVIPDKYSVYRDYLPMAKGYDGYIPRLVERLRHRGVHTIDLYTAYMEKRRSSPEPLYFVSDSHYTAAGKSILVDECLREIITMSGDGRFSASLPISSSKP